MVAPGTRCVAAPAGAATSALSLLRCLELTREHLGIGAEPVGLLDELAALDLEDLHPAATLVVRSAEFHWRYEATQGYVVDRLEALLHVVAGRLCAAFGLNRVANGLDMNGADQEAAIVIDGVRHFLWRLLALGLIHGDDFLAHGIVVTHAGELDRVIPLGNRPAAGGLDVGLSRGPDHHDHLGKRVTGALQLLHCDRWRPPEEMRDDEIGPEALRDVEHLRTHLDAGRRYGESLELKFLGLL